MGDSGLFIYLAIGAAGLATMLLLATAKHGRAILAFCIGVSAGFILLQFGGVHLYSILVCIFAIISRHVRRDSLFPPIALTLSAILFASTAAYGDLVKSNGIAVQLLIMCFTTFLLWLRSDLSDLRSATFGLLTITSLGSLVGILQTLNVVPMQLFQLANAEMHRPAAWYPEPDWLGLYSAVALVLTLALIRDGRVRFALAAVNGAAVLLASARAAWLGLIVVLAWAIARSLFNRTNQSHRSRNTIVLLLLAGLIFAEAAFPAQVELALNRLLSALQPGGGDSAVVARYGQIDGLLNLISTAPLHGHGISAGGRVGGFGMIDFSDVSDGNSTASNWLLALIAEGMLVAVPLILMVLFLAFFGARTLGAQSAVLLILVNSLFSNAFYFPITWFLLAACLAKGVIESKHELSDAAVLQRGRV